MKLRNCSLRWMKLVQEWMPFLRLKRCRLTPQQSLPERRRFCQRMFLKLIESCLLSELWPVSIEPLARRPPKGSFFLRTFLFPVDKDEFLIDNLAIFCYPSTFFQCFALVIFPVLFISPNTLPRSTYAYSRTRPVFSFLLDDCLRRR